MSYSRLELDKEFVFSDFAEVVLIGFLGIVLDTIVELFTEVLWSAFLQLTQPHFNVLHSFINNVLERALWSYHAVNGTHQIGEHSNAEKFDDHLDDVLDWCISLEVTIANRGQSCDDPVERHYVDRVTFLVVKLDLAIFRAVVDPATFCDFTDINPNAAKNVDCREQVYKQIEDVEQFFDASFVQPCFLKQELYDFGYCSVSLASMRQTKHFEPIDTFGLIPNERRQSWNYIDHHGVPSIILENLKKRDWPNSFFLERSYKFDSEIYGHNYINDHLILHRYVQIWYKRTTIFFEDDILLLAA